MAPIRARGGFRGRGGGRGGLRGRGRGGRGGRGFAAVRRDEGGDESSFPKREPPEREESLSDPSDDSASDEEDDDNDDEAQPVPNAYATLLQSLSSRSGPDEHRTKKRKLRHENEHDFSRLRRDSEVESDVENPEENEQLSEESEGEEEVEADEEAEEAAELDGEGANGFQDPDESDENWFQAHFTSPDETELAARVERIKGNQWVMKRLDVGEGRGILQVPCADDTLPLQRKLGGIHAAQLKGRLINNAQKRIGSFNEVEKAVAPSIFAYQDLLFGARTVQNAGRLRDIVCLHTLNHILMTRDRVLKNNAKLAAANAEDDAEYRDQGFTRPKILFLLETKQACVRVLNSITQLYDFEQQENKKRFLENFSQPEDTFSIDKPADFRELFEGNDDNEFRVGIKLTRKTLKLYSTFYSSDIIFASTLGLRRAIEAGDPKKQDSDFLSSIEIVIMEQADANLMQNWEHTEFVFDHLNLQPKEAHGCDFSRVRSWYLDGHAPHIRQTIVLSAYFTPKINALFNKHMRNVAGRLKYTPDYTAGLIESLSLNIKQTFLRFNSPSHLTDPDARFKYFQSSIFPSIARLPRPPSGGLGVLLFIPSYLDFVRVRNALVDSDLSYASISEYTDPTDVRKARSHFMNGKHSLLLYTGRAHHFHRYSIRGVKKVIFYGVPENPVFYEEALGFIGKTLERGESSKAEVNVRICFSKWERVELERIVGTKRVGKMVGDKEDVFDFV